jgi:hypothetical protein
MDDLAYKRDYIAGLNRQFGDPLQSLEKHPADMQGVSDHEPHKQVKLAEAIGYAARHYKRPFYSLDKPDTLAELLSELHDLCSIYLQAPARQRSNMREAIGKDKDARRSLACYIAMAIEEFYSTGQPTWLVRGLVAISIEDLRRDFRDSFGELGLLYQYAVRAGIDPTPYFRAVGDLSNPQVPAHSFLTKSTRAILLGFQDLSYFKASVLPKLNQPPQRRLP